jgi:hypothetical protein
MVAAARQQAELKDRMAAKKNAEKEAERLREIKLRE